MQHIFVYGDSLSWGIVPNTRQRFPFDVRWPGAMEKRLNANGPRVRVTEDCVNGRRTVWDDPFKPGRNGLVGLGARIEAQSPIALLILMLGTNDFQFNHVYNNAQTSALGIAALVNEIRRAPIEPGMPVPPILIACPPPMQKPGGQVGLKFHGAEERSKGLAAAYEETGKSLGCSFFDAGNVTQSSRVDGIHLDEDQHLTLGAAIADFVAALL
ncbi:MAG TPA: SGNH/GDSL hydrolase family protein [Bryobacteraceae bacterium]|nr:SGNH/GDSL hydrolase family protein [Bryobacteraceae bacterium]